MSNYNSGSERNYYPKSGMSQQEIDELSKQLEKIANDDDADHQAALRSVVNELNDSEYGRMNDPWSDHHD